MLAAAQLLETLGAERLRLHGHRNSNPKAQRIFIWVSEESLSSFCFWTLALTPRDKNKQNVFCLPKDATSACISHLELLSV